MAQTKCRLATCSSTTMGLLLSLPIAGGLTTIATSCIGGIAFCFTSTAGMDISIFSLYSLMHPQLPCFSSHVTATLLLRLELASL